MILKLLSKNVRLLLLLQNILSLKVVVILNVLGVLISILVEEVPSLKRLLLML